MNIQFVPVTSKNIGTVKKLHIKSEQKGMCESVEECYEEALIFTLWHPVVIVIDDEMIGFAMYGLWKDEGENGRVWLDRYFIDEEYQGRGYGTKILPALLSHIKKIYAIDTIYLSVYEGNTVAMRLYEKMGFVLNGELDINGELVMVNTK